MSHFLSLGISKELVEKLRDYGIAKPTPIQEKVIPFVMDGTDMIAQAQTGTGKTFAFILPILEKIDWEATHVQALIVTPTRELALQITDEIEKLIADTKDFAVLAVYGGQDVEKQLKKLKRNPPIVVGTPGRLLDHIRRETIDLSGVSFLVLDEADQMLHIGFLGEVENIIRETSAKRQTLLFSATIPSEVRKLATKYMRAPEYIQIEKTQGPTANVKQIAIQTTDRSKQAALIQLVETHRPFLAVVFCRTKRRVSKLYNALTAQGFSCDELHGDLSQAKRERVIKRFRDAEIQLLIATDVAARGLDIEGVTHVFNYDIPEDAESYVHRIGRTGRAGMKGLAVTLYSSANRPTLEMIEKELNIRIEKLNQGNVNTERENLKEGNKNRHNDQKEKNGTVREKRVSDHRNRKITSKRDKQPGRSGGFNSRDKETGKPNGNPSYKRNEKKSTTENGTKQRSSKGKTVKANSKRRNSTKTALGRKK